MYSKQQRHTQHILSSVCMRKNLNWIWDKQPENLGTGSVLHWGCLDLGLQSLVGRPPLPMGILDSTRISRDPESPMTK